MPRGKIMRDTNSGPGIVFVEGVQKPFTLESHWRSGTPPKVEAVVEVTLDDTGNTVSVEVVEEAALAKEQAKKALNFASENGKQYFALLLARVGAPTLVATALLLIGWIFLAALSVRISASFGSSITFYEVLKLANAGGNLDALGAMPYASAGLYGLAMWIALLAPLVSHFHGNKYLTLGYCAPLAFTLLVTLNIYLSIKASVDEAQKMTQGLFGKQFGKMMESMSSEVFASTLKALSLGFGTYLTGAIALYLTYVGVKKFLASNATA